jgi:Exocyst complex component Sec5
LTQFSSILLELSTSDKPIWVYFDSQHKHILQRVKSVYDIALIKVIGMYLFPLLDIVLSNTDQRTQQYHEVSQPEKIAGSLAIGVAALEGPTVDATLGNSSTTMYHP